MMRLRGAMLAKMRNGGAACTAANRFYVAKEIVNEFTEKLTKAMGALKVAPGLRERRPTWRKCFS